MGPEQLRSARWDITLVFFVHGAVYANWVPRIPLIKRELGLGDGSLGLALLGAPVGVVLAVRAASWTTARWGSRAVTRGASLATCASLVPIGVAWNLGSLMAALLVMGASLGLMDVAMNAQGVVVERGYKRPIMSSLHGSYSVGALVGALAGSGAAHFAVRPVAHFAVASAVLGTVVWFGSRRLLRDDGELSQDQPSGGGGRLFRGYAAVMLLGVVGLCSFVGEGAVADWSAVYLREDLSVSAGQAGLGYAGCAIAMAVGRLSGDRLVARFGPVTVLRVGALVAGLGLGLGLLARNQPVAIAGFTLFGLGIAPVAPITFSAAGNLPDVPSATAISRVTGIGYLGFLAGPPLIGLVAEVAGLGWALVIPAGLAAVMVLLAGATAPARAGSEDGAGEAACER
ncbi:MFS transporter [Wenjunlia tyrosinilytica]|uniref:MFS transporter n=1 Tax=Wenjunlia tyrosinilytica TaxID=1544741 RepID=A0A917ZJU2_9ACTN|nr:MFS transporter [Wenjunlia tyrosinilytica]GGO84922.1 MFS transporter [Wenjunlia tyrosinilytica]